jgi:putative holliday junction resolvase
MPILPDPFSLPAGRLLALDVGEARIGVASCDELGLLASPLTVLRRAETRAEDFEAIGRLAEREKAAGLLVGLPLASLGEIGPQAKRVRRYTSYMAQAVLLPIAFWDESYSTSDAAGLLEQAGASTRARPGGRLGIDAAAAAVILASYLEARRSRS